MFINNKSKVNLPLRQYHEYMYLARSQTYHLTFFSLNFLIIVINDHMGKDMSPVQLCWIPYKNRTFNEETCRRPDISHICLYLCFFQISDEDTNYMVDGVIV